MSEHHGHIEVKMGSDRGFGLVFFAAFLVIALLPLFNAEPPRLWAAAVAILFLAVALVKPSMLSPLNRLWFRFGLLLGAVVAPIVMSLLFFIVITPTGLLMRALGKDPLCQKFDKTASTYWIEREEPVGPMKNQF